MVTTTTVHKDFPTDERHNCKDHNHTVTEDGGTLSGPVVTDYIEFAEAATPSTPASGFVRLYPKSDKRVYYTTSAGVESAVIPSGTAFPGTPADQDPFQREDLGNGWVWDDGLSVWLGPERELTLTPVTNQPYTVNAVVARGGVPDGKQLQITGVDVLALVLTTNNGSDFWAIGIDGDFFSLNTDTYLLAPDTLLSLAQPFGLPVLTEVGPSFITIAAGVNGAPGDLFQMLISVRVRDVLT